LREDGERFEVGSLPFQSCVAFAEAVVCCSSWA
jgi:hypothetical protein